MQIERVGDWMQTVSGIQFFPMDPRPEEISIEDIAHHLSNLCRFTGAVRSFYSVAQHSYLVSLHVPAEFALQGLLHDATEAYLADLNRPVKHSLGLAGYREIERALEIVIMRKFRLPLMLHSTVKIADDAVLMAERRDLMSAPPGPWSTEHQAPIAMRIRPWLPEFAKKMFLSRYSALTGEVLRG